MINLTLDTAILSEALQQYRSEKGRGAFAELHHVSGVHNIGRIAAGTTIPNLETWMQLYAAMPGVIPPPTTTSGSVFKLVGEGSLDDRPERVERKAQLKGEGRLWALYARHRSAAVVAALTTVLEKMDRALTKATERYQP